MHLCVALVVWLSQFFASFLLLCQLRSGKKGKLLIFHSSYIVVTQVATYLVCSTTNVNLANACPICLVLRLYVIWKLGTRIMPMKCPHIFLHLAHSSGHPCVCCVSCVWYSKWNLADHWQHLEWSGMLRTISYRQFMPITVCENITPAHVVSTLSTTYYCTVCLESQPLNQRLLVNTTWVQRYSLKKRLVVSCLPCNQCDTVPPDWFDFGIHIRFTNILSLILQLLVVLQIDNNRTFGGFTNSLSLI